jgi:hypothetical protein
MSDRALWEGLLVRPSGPPGSSVGRDHARAADHAPAADHARAAGPARGARDRLPACPGWPMGHLEEYQRCWVPQQGLWHGRFRLAR